jgi:hypothetical protein
VTLSSDCNFVMKLLRLGFAALAGTVDADKIKTPANRGAIAQLGERIVRNDEVVGSIPTSSTKFRV